MACFEYDRQFVGSFTVGMIAIVNVIIIWFTGKMGNLHNLDRMRVVFRNNVKALGSSVHSVFFFYIHVENLRQNMFWILYILPVIPLVSCL